MLQPALDNLLSALWSGLPFSPHVEGYCAFWPLSSVADVLRGPSVWQVALCFSGYWGRWDQGASGLVRSVLGVRSIQAEETKGMGSGWRWGLAPGRWPR